MATTTIERSAKAEIRKLIEGWAKAAQGFDLDAIMASYTPDIVAFDAVGKLRFEGAEAYRAHWKACAEMCPGQMIFEVHDLVIEAGDDLAFGHHLMRCGMVGEDGKEDASYMRGTFGCRRQGGRWLIAHEHFSVPFDPESSKALLGLEP